MYENGLKIRKFVRNDLNSVLDLHRKAMEDVNAFKGDGPWDEDLTDIERYYNDDSGLFLVGEKENVILSMGAFRKIDENVAEIKRMRTYPEYQGKGYGKMILIELIKAAKELNYKELILETSEKQLKARKLYNDCGFMAFKNEIIDGYNCSWFRLVL